jgi:hypothetical protein
MFFRLFISDPAIVEALGRVSTINYIIAPQGGPFAAVIAFQAGSMLPRGIAEARNVRAALNADAAN